MKIPVGISSCLLGERVRYDGGHKLDTFIKQALGDYFAYSTFCPEVAIGMGIPREPIRLVRLGSDSIRCVAVDDSGRDFTQALVQCTDRQREWHEKLCGYILKKNSPSCGMEQVKIWTESSVDAGEEPGEDGVGIYAAKLMENFPTLPVIDEARLGDAVLRENFIQQVFALHRWRLENNLNRNAKPELQETAKD